MGDTDSQRSIRTGVLGCGSVAGCYLPRLKDSPYVEVVSLCDTRAERAAELAHRYGIDHHYGDVGAFLAGEPFELLVNLTAMQEHERLNRLAIESGKHVWSEKPIAGSLQGGWELLRLAEQHGVRIWGAPITVQSPQFAFMARAIRDGKLGRVAAAHADYGHGGPDWSAFFYEPGGGSMPDLAVYNLTTLTGLLGPAKSVSAMLSIVTPKRTVEDKGRILVSEEDNAMILLEHEGGAISHVQSGFSYFNPHGHDGSEETRHSITIVGTGGYMGLVGYDWGPLGVDIATTDHPALERVAEDPEGYVWEQGAELAAECLTTGREMRVTPEHALHVVEIMSAAHESQSTNRRIPLKSTFPWPLPV